MGILGLFIAWALTRHTVLTAFEPGFLQFLGIMSVRLAGQKGSGVTVRVVKLVKEAEKVRGYYLQQEGSKERLSLPCQS